MASKQCTIRTRSRFDRRSRAHDRCSPHKLPDRPSGGSAGDHGGWPLSRHRSTLRPAPTVAHAPKTSTSGAQALRFLVQRPNSLQDVLDRGVRVRCAHPENRPVADTSRQHRGETAFEHVP